MSIELGRVAYEGYRAGAGGKSLISGDTLPEWADLKPSVREAWRASADAVVMYREMRGPCSCGGPPDIDHGPAFCGGRRG